MKTYTAMVEWDPYGVWVVTVPEVPGALTQVERLDEVAENIGEAIELMTGEEPGSYELTIRKVEARAS